MFSKSKDETVTTNPARVAPAKSQASNSAPSIIGSDVHIVGNVSTAGEIQLDGIVEGDISCGALTVGEHGRLAGSIAADSITIRGKVEGEIRGRSVRLEKSAKVSGDVWHETIAIEAGAFMEGKFVHAKNAASEAVAKPAPSVKSGATGVGAEKKAPPPSTNGRDSEKTVLERV